MRRLLICLLLLTWQSANARAEEDRQLRYGGIPVDFVRWAPGTPSFTYGDLDISAAREEQLRGEAVTYVNRLHRFELERRSDGSLMETLTLARRYMTSTGIADNGNLQFWVDSSSQSATIEQAYTLLPGGERVEVELQAVQLIADQEDDIFTDDFQVIVPYSGLVPGAVTVLVVKLVEPADARPFPWSRHYHPQLSQPLEEFDLWLSWEGAGEPPRLESDFERLTYEKPAERTLHCYATAIPAFPADPDIQYSDVLPSVVAAGSISWEQLAQRGRRLVESGFSKSDIIHDTLGNLLAGARDSRERLDRIHRFVSQEIRYVGLEQGTGDVRPRPSELTLRRRFGDCKDKTTLFVDLARRAGLDAYAVLTSSTRTDVGKLLLPAASYFDHMIACVADPGGGEHCLDLTDPYSPWTSLSGGAQGAVQLALNGRTFAPANLPAEPHLWKVSASTITDIAEDGLLKERRRRTYHDYSAARMRSALLSRNQAARQQWLLDGYHETVSDVVDPTFEVVGIDDVHLPISVMSHTEFPPIDPKSTIYSEYETDVSRARQNLGTGNRIHDYAFTGAAYQVESLIYLPSTKRATYAGPRINFESRFGSMRRTYHIDGRIVRVTTDVSIPRAVIPAGQVAEFNRFLEIVSDHARIWFALEPASDP